MNIEDYYSFIVAIGNSNYIKILIFVCNTQYKLFILL